MIGKRWAPSILRVLLVHPRRFNELLHSIPGISDRLLTERLRELEESGLVRRTVTHQRPVQVEYSLTAPGRDLGHVIVALRAWTDKWVPQEGWPSGEDEDFASPAPAALNL